MSVATQIKERPILFSGPMVRAILEGRKTQTRRVMNPQPPFWLSKQLDGGDREWRCAVEGSSTWGPGAVRGNAWACQTDDMIKCPYGKPGDRLWVREAFTYWERREDDDALKPGESRDYTKAVGFSRLCERLSHDGECYLKYAADSDLRSLGEWVYPHPIYEHCIGRFGKTIRSIHMPRWASRLLLEVTGVWVERLHEIDADAIAAEGFDFSEYHAIESFAETWDELNAKRGYPFASNPWVWVVEFRKVDQ